MAVLQMVLNALLVSDIASSFFIAHGNVTTGLPPLTQVKKQGTGVLKVPLSKAASTSSFSKRQDQNPLENVNNGYLITCEFKLFGAGVFILMYKRLDWNSSTACLYADRHRVFRPLGRSHLRQREHSCVL